MSVERPTITDLIISGEVGDIAPGVGAAWSTLLLVKRVTDTTAMLSVVNTRAVSLFGGRVRYYISDVFTSFHMAGQNHMTGAVAYDAAAPKGKLLGIKFVSEHNDANLTEAHYAALDKAERLLDSGKIKTDEPSVPRSCPCALPC